MENVLFVSNLNSAKSISVKNYYMNHRPGALWARYLDISVNPDEIIMGFKNIMFRLPLEKVAGYLS